MKVEEKCSVLGREKNELQSRIEENDEEVDELMKKYKAAIQQVSTGLTPPKTFLQDCHKPRKPGILPDFSERGKLGGILWEFCAASGKNCNRLIVLVRL